MVVPGLPGPRICSPGQQLFLPRIYGIVRCFLSFLTFFKLLSYIKMAVLGPPCRHPDALEHLQGWGSSGLVKIQELWLIAEELDGLDGSVRGQVELVEIGDSVILGEVLPLYDCFVFFWSTWVVCAMAANE